MHCYAVIFISFLILRLSSTLAIRQFPTTVEGLSFPFTEAPEYLNSAECQAMSSLHLVHVAMTLDSEYLRGTVAAIHSVLQHASCPESLFFHLIAAEFDPLTPRVLTQVVRSVFPSLAFKVYVFREDRVLNLISSSIRPALENPLNYARNYLSEILDPSVRRVIYLDSDIVLVDDIDKLWMTELTNNRVIGAPKYCHVNFTNYFTDNFWSDQELNKVFRSRVPCYFNTGVMVMDLLRWRSGNYRALIEDWMEVQRKNRIYNLGSLPPFLLVFGGNVEPVDHRWNQHGLGGDNISGNCRGLHPGPVSLLHWSGKGKPWIRLDNNTPCPLDYLWQPYDLFKYFHQSEIAWART